GHDHRRGRVGVEPGGAARARDGGHPARPHGAAQAVRRRGGARGGPTRDVATRGARKAGRRRRAKRHVTMIRQVLRDGRDSAGGGGSSRAPLASVARPPVPWLDPPPGPWTVERAYAYCEQFARAHTESFPVASRFVPLEVRPHLVALYAFARSADDF